MIDVATIEKEFKNSWDEIEEFFKDLTSNKGWEYVSPILQIISRLRQLGYDKVLRAGKSVYVLRLSRSLKYGLMDDQHHLGVMVTLQNTFDIHYVVGENIIEQYETDDVLSDKRFFRLLDDLTKLPIN